MNAHSNYRCKKCGEIIRGYPYWKRQCRKMKLKLFSHILKTHHINLWDSDSRLDERNIQEYFEEQS